MNAYNWHFGYIPRWVRNRFRNVSIDKSGYPLSGVITERSERVRGKHYEYMAVVVADGFSLCNSEDSIVKRRLR
jgi:hypothetical protein